MDERRTVSPYGDDCRDQSSVTIREHRDTYAQTMVGGNPITVPLSTLHSRTIINVLRRARVLSQIEIARLTGLAPQTVSNTIAHLDAKGLIKESGVEPVDRGRPRKLLSLRPLSRLSIGIHIDPSRLTTVLMDLPGKVVATRTEEGLFDDTPHESTDQVIAQTRAMLDEADIDEGKIIGTGIATPGPIDQRAGRLISPGWMPGWFNFAIRDVVGALKQPPVHFVKDTFAAITGEMWMRDVAAETASMIYLYIGMGTGIGVSHHGRPLAGASGNVGELGRLFSAVSSTEGRYTLGGEGEGREHDPIELVKVARFHDLIPPAIDPNKPNRDAEYALQQLVKCATGGNCEALRLLHRAARTVGRAVAVACELFDVDEVVVGGPYWDLLRPHYIDDLSEAILSLQGRASGALVISDSVMSVDVGAIGAASTVFDQHYMPRIHPIVDR